MIYSYNKSKFSNKIFYSKLRYGKLEHLSGVFIVSILPFISYTGKYFIHSVAQKDNKRTIFLTMKSDFDDFDLLDNYNKYFSSLSHNGKKLMIFKEEMNGIILKF